MGASAWRKLMSTLQLSRDYEVKPAGLQWRSNTYFIVATVAIGLFTDQFLYSLIVPILPFMLEDRIGVPMDQVQSHVSGLLAAYAGASLLFSPIAGIISDKTSTRQGPFLFGLSSLLLATILLFSATTVPVLVIARILQGAAAAVVWTVGLALCLETVGPGNLGKTIGSIFSFISIGNLAGPSVGGVLYKKTGYAGVAGVAFAILVLDLSMRLVVIEKKVCRKYDADDAQNAQDPDTTPNHGLDGNEERGSSGEEQPLLGNRNDEDQEELGISQNQPWIVKKVPILPCLKNPRLLTALLVEFVQAILLGNFDATVPTVAQEFFNFDSLYAGILFLPLSVGAFIIGPIAGWAVDRYGTKPLAVAGYAYLVPALIILRVPHAGGKDQAILYGALLALCGAGLSVIGSISIVEAGAVVQEYHEANPDFFGEDGHYAQLYGLLSIAYSLGLVVGPELAGELKQSIGYGNMNVVLGVISAVTAAICFVWIGGKPKMMK